MLTVTVQDGTVDLWGLVHSVEEKKQQNSRPVSARSLITSSFNLSAQAGRELTKLP